ncbi:MAG: septum formation protein Maf [Phycisphaerae bacterium]|nr:septum formation protein Maf [Phycisphaerae bacterium]
MELILASSSPRRRKLLSQAGFVFRVVTPELLEDSSAALGQSAIDRARALALAKARSVAPNFSQALVLGADTLVALGEQVIGKARDRQHARQILTTLSGTTHQVITALALIFTSDGRTLLEHDTTSLTMAQLSAEQIDHYLRTGPWQGKAGAYALQENDSFISNVEGSFSNVVGLPLELFERMLRDLLPARLLSEIKA